MAKKILVVVDMQNDFIDGALGTAEAQAIVPNVVEKIQNFDGDIIWTKDTHFEDYLDTQEGKKLPVKHCIKDTHGWELNKDVLAVLDKVENIWGFEKFTFGSTSLAKKLEEYNLCGIEEITFIGLCTDICVISNALLVKAHLPEVTIKVDAKCCAGVTPESHNNALEAMKMCQIEII